MGTGIMIYTRKYLQFNDLVFDGYDMIRSVDDSSTSFKQSTQNYSYGHGSYTAFKNDYLYVEESDLSMTLFFNVAVIDCEQREFYVQFITEQLSKPGKLWAVKNGSLVWAFAYPTSFSEVYMSSADSVELNVDFKLYEGVWHKADRLKTFLEPFNICTFLDCMGYKEKDCPPMGDDCCSCVNPVQIYEGCECCCEELTKEMALCYNKDILQDFYGKAGVNFCGGLGYRIVYDCIKGQELFGDEFLGDKICGKDNCKGIIAGILYSDTEIPTTDVSIIINGGKMHNPYIEINGNGNYIEGDYEGVLRINSNGDIYAGDECCQELISPSKWNIPGGMTYGWTIKPRNNRILVDLGTCCGATCVYIQVDALTL